MTSSSWQVNSLHSSTRLENLIQKAGSINHGSLSLEDFRLMREANVQHSVGISMFSFNLNGERKVIYVPQSGARRPRE